MIDFFAKDISKATGATESNVLLHWPAIRRALAQKAINGRFALIAAIATIRVEATTKFAPISELGNTEYFTAHYERNKKVARALGNTQPGDGARFHGRGFIQITGRSNYAKYGKETGFDLLEQPDLANRPDIAAAIFAAYFRDHGVDVWAEKAGHAQDINEATRYWQMTRKLVNGGLNGWALYFACIKGLEQCSLISVPDVPAVAQALPKPAPLPKHLQPPSDSQSQQS